MVFWVFLIFFSLRCLLFSTRLFIFLFFSALLTLFNALSSFSTLFFQKLLSIFFSHFFFFKTEGDWKRDRSVIPSVFLERDGNVDRRPALLVQTEEYNNRYVF